MRLVDVLKSVLGRARSRKILAEMTPFEQLIYFVKERESIRLKKEAGELPPWTEDPILGNNRFTNVNREDDKVTRWIAKHWRTPYASDPDLWFAMVVARHVNLPHTLLVMGYPVPWNAEKFVESIRAVRSQRLPAYNAAYMIRAAKGTEYKDKAEYLAKAVMAPLWERREEIRPRAVDTLEEFHLRLMTGYGMGSFLAAQVVADMKHVEPLRSASDWKTWAASGPGSRRGLNRILGNEPKKPWTENGWREAFGAFYASLQPYIQRGELPDLDAQCYQNVLCEVDKYLRTFKGEGRPKQRYVPQPPSLLGDV